MVAASAELRRLANEIDRSGPLDIPIRTERIREIADEIEPRQRQRFYRFNVKSTFPFPADMLRYDRCWPADSETASLIDASHTPERDRAGIMTYRLECWSTHGPNRARWESFMYRVENVEEVP